MPYKDSAIRLAKSRERTAKWRRDNPGRDSVSARKRAAERKAWLNTFKVGPCTDCSISYPPYVLDFDHRPGTVKLFNLGRHGKLYSRAGALAEMAKCDLVCANCHRIRTFARIRRGPH